VRRLYAQLHGQQRHHVFESVLQHHHHGDHQ
jgi:hypothetical protein